jgi:hypothetical protein
MEAHMSSSTTTTANGAAGSQGATTTPTKLSTVLEYMGAGPSALASMELRLRTLAGYDNRIKVGEIMEREGEAPTCEVTFECTGYAEPVDGVPDPRAVEDLKKLLGDINGDGCLLWSTIAFLVDD